MLQSIDENNNKKQAALDKNITENNNKKKDAPKKVQQTLIKYPREEKIKINNL